MAVTEPRNFLLPCLLLLLRERADHGYELVSRLRPLHDAESDSGGVYRALRQLERRGLVRSEWCTSGAGPARRTYHLTVDGAAYLDAQVAELEHAHDSLHRFLDRYGHGRVGERTSPDRLSSG
jgi:PadR family transcriptional regulator PadR